MQKLVRPNELLYPIGILGTPNPQLTFAQVAKVDFLNIKWITRWTLHLSSTGFGDPEKGKGGSEEMHPEQLSL